LLASLPAQAQSASEAAARDADMQRRQAQELEAQRARAAERPDVFSAAPQMDGGLDFPAETPCFVIRQLTWQGDPPDDIRQAAGAVLGRCIGATGLLALQQYLVTHLTDAGLVTSRVLVPEQSLAAGTLILRYVPGRIAAVRSEDGAVGWWAAALPAGSGAALSQRDLDQGLENIRRLDSQSDATIDIAPGPQLGDSDVVIHPGTGKRWHAYVGGDNAGLDATGKNQVNAGLTLDSPFFLYDQISAAWSSNAHWRDSQAYTRSASVDYSVPYGYWLFTLGVSRSTYRQTVAGFMEPIVYGGQTRQLRLGASVVPYRGANYKGNVSFALLKKRVDSTLNDVQIDVQRRDVTGYELGYAHRHYVGRAALDAGVGVQGTLPGLSKQPGFVAGSPAWSGRSLILTANAGLYLPFELAGQPLAYQGTWRIQHAKTAVVPSDYFTIGNRYTVRGFDGQMTLAAEDGWSLRNDLSWSLEKVGAPGQSLYAGLDAGRVGGPSAPALAGRTLVGAAAGLRGSIDVPHVKASYDISAGWPLKKPEFLETSPVVFAASLMFSF
jgi:hemolysin activation/secretion protein